jgi:hypothetical protein
MPRTAPPPLGAIMPFASWARRITELLRSDLPDLAATGSSKSVTWRYLARTATLKDNGDDTWWFSFGAIGATAPTMASLFDTRHDEFTARNFSRTLAGYFDDRFCTPRND